MTPTLTANEARRIALAAQGFGAPRPARPGLPHVRAVAKRLHALQLDSVNVLVRAHYLPPFSRLGPYPMRALDELVNVRRELIELVGHQASFVPVELQPLFRWRGDWERSDWARGRERIERERPGYIAAVEREVSQRGPIALSDLPDQARRDPVPTKYAASSTLWWRWSEGKAVLDGLVSAGRLALAGRRDFERLYDLTERVVPPEVLAQPTPAEPDAKRELVRLSARALGVATVKDLAGYFMLKVAETRRALGELVDAGALMQVQVEGWPEQAFLDGKAKTPESVAARALLSPFDSLTWSRDRTKRLFNFDFSFEIYVPASKRKFGYYVLPFMMDEGLVARVDLKADRRNATLLVPGAFLEPGRNPRQVVPELADELRKMAAWLGLERIEVGERGDLATKLAGAARRT